MRGLRSLGVAQPTNTANTKNQTTMPNAADFGLRATGLKLSELERRRVLTQESPKVAGRRPERLPFAERMRVFQK